MSLDESPVVISSGKERDWWDIFVKEQFPDEKCLKYFKCSRRTYGILIKALRPYIMAKIGTLDQDSLYLRKGVSVEKQVAILLYKLTSCADYVAISKKFKVHKSTIHKILYKGILALNKYLLHSTINMPKSQEAEIIADYFEESYKIPQIIGAMTTVHIPISSPINLNYKFLNSKLYPSFILQSVIDSNCLFRDVSVRHAGAAEPHLVLTDSSIYKYSEKVMPFEKRNINGSDISYKIIGPTSGPLYSWLLTDYTVQQSSSEALFNAKLKEIRNYTESVIAKLRARFLILSHTIELSYKVVPQVIAACCIIHNICEREGDLFLDEWLAECDERLKRYPQPDTAILKCEPVNEMFLRERDVLRDYLACQTSEINSCLS